MTLLYSVLPLYTVQSGPVWRYYRLPFLRSTELEYPIKYLRYTKCLIELTEENCVETRKCPFVMALDSYTRCSW